MWSPLNSPLKFIQNPLFQMYVIRNVILNLNACSSSDSGHTLAE